MASRYLPTNQASAPGSPPDFMELNKAGVDVTLICDNMASSVMKKGWIDAVVVGCDRIGRQRGRSQQDRHFGSCDTCQRVRIPFYMFVPTSTIDMDTPDGDHINIELRQGDEIYKMWYKKPMAPEGIKNI